MLLRLKFLSHGLLAKRPYIVPIPGLRQETRIKENLDAADIVLTSNEIKKIDAVLDSMKMSAVFGGHHS